MTHPILVAYGGTEAADRAFEVAEIETHVMRDRQRVECAAAMSSRPLVQYCSECLCRFRGDADRCSECGAAASGLNYKEAQQRLLDMLARESAAGSRMRAIAALGHRGEPDHAATLVDIALNAPAGSPEGIAFVQCLERLVYGAARRELLSRIAENHADPEVRMAARRALLRGP